MVHIQRSAGFSQPAADTYNPLGSPSSSYPDLQPFSVDVKFRPISVLDSDLAHSSDEQLPLPHMNRYHSFGELYTRPSV